MIKGIVAVSMTALMMYFAGVFDAHAKDGRSTYMANLCRVHMDSVYFNGDLKGRYRFNYLGTHDPKNTYGNTGKHLMWIYVTAYRDAPWDPNVELSYRLSCQIRTTDFKVVDWSKPTLYLLEKKTT